MNPVRIEPRCVVEPLTPLLGAEILGVNLAEPLAASTVATLRDAFRRHHLLLLRNQDITTGHQTALASLFGEVKLREKNRIKSTEAGAQHVSNVRADGVFGTGELDFHMDQLFQPEPLAALILYAMEVPESGGDTLFVNTMAAHERMPAALRERIAGLSCLNAYTFAGALAKDWNVDDASVQKLSQVHPMVWRDPVTGRGAIWVNKLSSLDVVGLPEAEGKALMAEVRSYLEDQEIIYRHQWRPGDLLLWDNLRLQHARTPFDPAQRRTLR